MADDYDVTQYAFSKIVVPLDPYLDDPQRSIRLDAALALSQLLGQPFPYNDAGVAQAKAWWEEEKRKCVQP